MEMIYYKNENTFDSFVKENMVARFDKRDMTCLIWSYEKPKKYNVIAQLKLKVLNNYGKKNKKMVENQGRTT